MPSAYDLTVYRGDTYTWDFRLWNDVGKTQPTDLTGIMVKAEIRDRPAGSLIVPLTLTVILPNTIHASLDAPHSSQLPVPTGVWDLQLTYPDTSVLTVLGGNVAVTADVTDSSPPGVTARVRLIA
jgi:hypothetical protein